MNRIRILRSLPILCLTLLLSISVTDAQHLSLKQVTFSDSTHDGYPYWSPDGEYIIYSAGSRDHVYTMRIPSEGGAPEVVTDVFAHHATWSPDGAYIAFDGYMGSLIQLVSSTGGTPVRIVPESIPVVHSGYPNWSPGGGRIAFMSGGDVWILELENGIFSNVFQIENKLAIPFDWTPDGSLMLFTSAHGGNLDLWVMSAEGGDPVQLTFYMGNDSNPGNDLEGSWSPDGKKIAFSSTRSGYWAIWVMEPDPEFLGEKLGIIKGSQN